MKYTNIGFLLCAFLVADLVHSREIDPAQEFLQNEKLLIEYAYRDKDTLKKEPAATEIQLEERERVVTQDENFPISIIDLEKKLGKPDRIANPPGSFGDNIASLLWEFTLPKTKGKCLRYVIVLSDDRTHAVAINRQVLREPRMDMPIDRPSPRK
jgi:hypothetical protein